MKVLVTVMLLLMSAAESAPVTTPISSINNSYRHVTPVPVAANYVPNSSKIVFHGFYAGLYYFLH